MSNPIPEQKLIYLYGAGTEVDLCQPSGVDYKNKTIFSKNEELT